MEEDVSLTSVAAEPSHIPCPTCDVVKFKDEEKFSPLLRPKKDIF